MRLIKRAPWEVRSDPDEGVSIHDAGDPIHAKLAQGVDGFSGRTR